MKLSSFLDLPAAPAFPPRLDSPNAHNPQVIWKTNKARLQSAYSLNSSLSRLVCARLTGISV